MSIENLPKKNDVEELEEKARRLEEKSARLNAEIIALEEEIRRREFEEQTKKEEPATMSRRSMLKILAVGGAGLVLTKAGIKTTEPERKTPEKPKEKPEATQKPETPLENKTFPEKEIEACADIIKNEQYAEIIKHPRLVSALYYSDKAIETFGPVSKNDNEAIIWNIYPLITKKFRENYINFLKNLVEEKRIRHKLNLSSLFLPIAAVSFGKNLEENHLDAIDLFIREGSPVRAMVGGLVVLAESGWKEEDELSTSSVRGGNTVIIFDPKTDSFYRYAHLKEVAASSGEVIPGGTHLGTVGNTGINASKSGHGGHLHFEINKYDKVRGVMVAQNVHSLRKKLERL